MQIEKDGIIYEVVREICPPSTDDLKDAIENIKNYIKEKEEYLIELRGMVIPAFIRDVIEKEITAIEEDIIQSDATRCSLEEELNTYE